VELVLERRERVPDLRGPRQRGAKWTPSGKFSSRTAYRAFFFGRTALPGAAQVWNAFAPFKYQFHAGLALRNRCWTADHLARRGLPATAICTLCDVAGETLDHLSLRCQFATAVYCCMSAPAARSDSSFAVEHPVAVVAGCGPSAIPARQ
jgi:hypothetical protein